MMKTSDPVSRVLPLRPARHITGHFRDENVMKTKESTKNKKPWLQIHSVYGNSQGFIRTAQETLAVIYILETSDNRDNL